MSSAEINCKFKELLSQLHQEIFKPRGFSKSNQDFMSYSKENLGKHINFQKSRDNFGDVFEFTVNIEVFLTDGTRPKSKLQINPVFRNRIGYFSYYYNGDQWWYFSSENYDDIYNEIKSAFLNDVFPVLDSFECKDDLVTLYRSQKFNLHFWSQKFENEMKLLDK